MKRLAILALWSVVARGEPSPSPIDPKSYLDEKAREEQAVAPADPKPELVRQNVVQIDGRPYYKFKAGPGAIFVPKVDHLTDEELQRAVCDNDLRDVCDPSKGGPTDPDRKALCDAQGIREALIAGAELELTGDTVAYAGMIAKTIGTTCGPAGHRPSARLLSDFFEIGLAKRSTDPRHPGEKKVFIRPFVPQVGAGATF